MKRIRHHPSKRNHENNLLHIETDFCIVNIRIGLTDSNGNNVTSVEIIPDDYSGEPKVTVEGSRNVRVIQEAGK